MLHLIFSPLSWAVVFPWIDKHFNAGNPTGRTMNFIKNVNPTEINALRNTRAALQRPKGEIWGWCPGGNGAQVISGAFRRGWALFPYPRISFSPCEIPPEQLHHISVPLVFPSLQWISVWLLLLNFRVFIWSHNISSFHFKLRVKSGSWGHLSQLPPVLTRSSSSFQEFPVRNF